MFDDSLIFYDEFARRDRSLEISPRKFDIDNPSMYQFLSACEFLRGEFSLAYSTGDNDILTHDFILAAFEILQNAPDIVDDFTDDIELDDIEVIEKYLWRVRNQVSESLFEEKFIPLDNAYFFNAVVRNTFERALLNWLAVAYVPNYERVLQGIFGAAQSKGGHLNLYGNHEVYMIGDVIQFDYTEIQNTDTVFLNGEILPQLIFITKAILRDRKRSVCDVKEKWRKMSQARFAAQLIHFGGKKNGEQYTEKTIKNWDKLPKGKRPCAGGIEYSPELRDDINIAQTWINFFNAENRNAVNARRARI